ncbi:SRPBCC family protein [Actinoplanes sp. NPDC051861]|uniref:SRPBCC family protein n=1 Tax=Actinoplanes sp. NPDC051861 TaxID=3155170 RepID=UPI003423D83F
MAVDVLTEIVIARPVDEVAAYAADPANAPHWYRNISSARWVTDPPLRLGSRIAFEARFLGRVLAYTYEIVEHEPGRRLVMRTAQGPFPMETTYTWEPVGSGGTRMTLRNRGEPAGFARFTAPMMAASMRRANSADLARLKTVLDGRGQP